MLRMMLLAILVLGFSSTTIAQDNPFDRTGNTPPLSIDISTNPNATQYASIVIYRWDAARQVGVLVEGFAVPAYPIIPVDPPGSGGGGGPMDPDSVAGGVRSASPSTHATSFPPIIVRGHRWWPNLRRLGYTLIDSYERIRSLAEGNLKRCGDAQRQRDFLRCEANDGYEPAQIDCGGVPNGFVADTAPAAANIFSSACRTHASCIRTVGASRANCARNFRTALEQKCDAFYPPGGFPGSALPPSEYQRLNDGCRIQAGLYSVYDIGDAPMVAMYVWLTNNSVPALIDTMPARDLPVSNENWTEAEHRAACKKAGDDELRYCM